MVQPATVVSLGSEGPYARAVQRVIGVPFQLVDGKFGPNSQAVCRAWQERHGIEPDGAFGELSRAAIEPGALARAYEGLVLRAYDDARDVPLSGRFIRRVGDSWQRLGGTPLRGWPTIGRGRLLGKGEWVETCTREEADRWFDGAVAHRFLPRVRQHLAAGDPARDCAVTSLGYNGGEGAIDDLAANSFDGHWWATHYCRTKGAFDVGLAGRRLEEVALWFGG